MAFRDIMLPALTYPERTIDTALISGVSLASRLGGELTLLSVEVDIPDISNPLADAMLQLSDLARQEENKSRATARLEALQVRLAADDLKVLVHTEARVARLYEDEQLVRDFAKTRDICLAPLGPSVSISSAIAEAVLFGSGRPVLIYPEASAIDPGDRFGSVVIAWDGSGRAARAVADAMPILRRATKVKVFTALGEKPGVTSGSATELIRYLAMHGVAASVDEQSVKGRRIGPVLADYASTQEADLLIMGGFGHARLREFVLGGATQAVLEAPPCPVLMSH